jgi:hypothetical protein
MTPIEIAKLAENDLSEENTDLVRKTFSDICKALGYELRYSDDIQSVTVQNDHISIATSWWCCGGLDYHEHIIPIEVLDSPNPLNAAHNEQVNRTIKRWKKAINEHEHQIKMYQQWIEKATLEYKE